MGRRQKKVFKGGKKMSISVEELMNQTKEVQVSKVYRFLEDNIKTILSLYEQGYSASDIAKLLNVYLKKNRAVAEQYNVKLVYSPFVKKVLQKHRARKKKKRISEDKHEITQARVQDKFLESKEKSRIENDEPKIMQIKKEYMKKMPDFDDV